MSDYKYFTVEQYNRVSVLTWTESAATRDSLKGELQVELQAFVLTTKPTCVVVSFAQLRHCPSALVNGVVGLKRQLGERGSALKLCEMNAMLLETLDRLHLASVFEIHISLSNALAACDEQAAGGGHDG